jgi:hypothetical protein
MGLVGRFHESARGIIRKKEHAMRKASLWVHLLAGIGFAIILAGGVVLAEPCENDGTCVTKRDSDGNPIGCGDTAGKKCDVGIACRCVANSANLCRRR